MIAWAVESLIAVTLLMLLVLAIRSPVARFCGAEWAYALWLLPLLRLVLPPLPFAACDFLSLVPPEAAFIPEAEGSAASAPPSGGSGLWLPLLCLWALGAAAFILWQLASYRRFLRALEVGMRPSRTGAYGGIPVIESEAAQGPLAVGIIDRRIAVPPLFEYRYTPAEQELALTHELIHHRRGDLVWNCAGLLVLALNWFNPIAYFAFSAFRADQELACDAAVARRSPGSHADYAAALVKAASRPGQIAACPLGSRQTTSPTGSLNSADQLKRRLKMLTKHRTSKGRSVGGAAALGVTFLAGLGLSPPGFAQEQPREEKEVRNIIIKRMGKGEGDIVIDGKRLSELRANCDTGNKQEADVTSGEGKDKSRTRVILCSKDGRAPSPELRERLVKALEKARSELGQSEHLSEKGRAQAVEALDREIARRRSEGK